MPPLPPSAGGRGLHRQHSIRNFRGTGVERSWSSSSRRGSRDRDYYSSGEEDGDGLVRIDEDYSGLGVGVGVGVGGGGIRGREAQYYHARRGYPPVTPGDGGGGGTSLLGRRRSSPLLARLRRQPSFQQQQQQQQQQSVGHNEANSLSLSRSSRQIYRGRRGQEAPGFPSEARGHNRAEPSMEFSPYATRSDIIPGGRAVEARDSHNQEPYYSRSSSRGSSRGTRHRRLYSDDQEEQDTVELDLDRARGASNASAGSVSSLLSSSSRRPFLEERSAERSGDRRRGNGAGASGAEDPRLAGRRGWFGWGKSAGTAGGAGSVAPSAGAGAEMIMHRRGESGRRDSFGLSEEYLDGIVGDGDGDDGLLSDGGFSDGFMFAEVGGGDLYGRRSEGDTGGVEMRPTLERSGSSLDFRRAMPHFRQVKPGY